ncbi:hypothetical protein HYH02_005211 [Chlamydomonas schloesseri]|uniref:Uncharacterized protein n=1 Tax=Chlamydomonas schloesseri TaxID=2026947 RepID=A0A835WLA2_9CHLO|nr:hypothetical protein HYH02_005211 [Chlamydomonas schloesseri]|eukprot:KAG2449682.1 hypothetical protein HYH02_005211 [Chlamydomonas schloesseri]
MDLPANQDVAGDGSRFDKALRVKDMDEERALRCSSAIPADGIDTPKKDSAASLTWGPGNLDNMLQEQGSWCRHRGDMAGVECVRYATRSVSSGGAAPASRLSAGGAGFFGSRRNSQDGHSHAHESLLEIRRRSSAGGAPFSTRSHRNSSGGSVEYELHSCYFNPLVEGSVEAEAEAERDSTEEPELAQQPVQEPAEAAEEAELVAAAAELACDGCGSGVSGRVTPGDALAMQLSGSSSARSSCSSASAGVLAAAAGGAPEAPPTPLQCVSSKQLGLAHAHFAASTSGGGSEGNNARESDQQVSILPCGPTDEVTATKQTTEGTALECLASSPPSPDTAAVAAASEVTTAGHDSDDQLNDAGSDHGKCPAAAAASFASSSSSAAGRRHQRTQSSYLDLAAASERLSSALSEHASYICLLPPPQARPTSQQHKPHRVSSPAVLAAHEWLGSPQRHLAMDTAAVYRSGGAAPGDADSAESACLAAAASIAHAPLDASAAGHVEPAKRAQPAQPGPYPQSPCVCGCMRAGCSVPGLCMTRALIKQMHLASRVALLPAPATDAASEPAPAAESAVGTATASTRSPFAAAFASAEAALAERHREVSCRDGGSSACSSEGGAVVTCVVVIPGPGAKGQHATSAAEEESALTRVVSSEAGGQGSQFELERAGAMARSGSTASSDSSELSGGLLGSTAALFSVHSSWREPLTWTPLRERCAAVGSQPRADQGHGGDACKAESCASEAAAPARAQRVVADQMKSAPKAAEAPAAEQWMPLRQRVMWMTRSGRQGGLAGGWS